MTRTPVVIVLVALVLGFAVGGVVGYGLGGASPADDAIAAPTGAPIARSPALADAGSPPQREVRARATVRATSGGAAPAPASAPAVGGGTIQGRVLGVNEEPLAGVLVRATPQWDSREEDEEEPSPAQLTPGSPPPAEDVEREIDRYAARMRDLRARTREATTDASGAFVLAGLTDSPHQVEAWLVGYRLERLHQGNGWVPVGTRCDFKAVPTGTMKLTILLPDGTQPKTAAITWRRAGEGEDSNWCWQRTAPQIAVEPGTYTLQATADPGRTNRGYSPFDGSAAGAYTCPPQTVTVTAGSAKTLTLQLAGRPGVVARVVFASPEHPRSCRVALMKLGEGIPADPALLLVEDENVKSQWLEKSLEASFPDLSAGTYLVGVSFRGGIVGPSATVVVGTELVTRELSVPAGELRDWVTVRVRAPGGALVRDVQITTGMRTSRGGESSADAQPSPQEDGSLRVEHFGDGADGNSWAGRFGGGAGFDRRSRRGAVAPAARPTYFVRATSERYGNAEATYDPATDREVTLQFGEPARLRATVSGFAASPCKERIQLALRPAERENRARAFSGDAAIDDAGAAKFGPCEPGRYEVVVSLSAEAEGPSVGRRFRGWGGTPVATIPVTLAAGDNEVTVVVPPVTDLVVARPDVAEPRQLRLQRLLPDGALEEAGWGTSGETGPDAVFPNLGPGRYRLVAEDGDMWVNVPAESHVAFKPRAFNALRVSLRGEAGYLSEAGLQEGDVVIAIDGTACENPLQIGALLAVAKTHDDGAKLAVLRADRRMEIAVDPKRLDDGGDLEAWVR